jgi:hypothetical protein
MAADTPRRAIRDQETLAGYLARIGQQAPPASAATVSRALAHYTAGYAALIREQAVPAPRDPRHPSL